MRLSVAFFLIPVLLPLWSFVASAQVGRFIYHSHRRLTLSANLDYFQTEANYLKSGGVYDSLPNGQAYRIFQLDLRANYGFQPGWNVYSGAKVGSAESQSSLATRTNSGVSDIYVGTNFIAMRSGSFYLVPNLYFSQPLVRNDVSSDVVSINDGAMEIAAELQAQWLYSEYHFGTYSGYIYRDSGLSSLIPYGVFGELPLGQMLLGSEIYGYSSASSDRDSTNDSSRTLFMNRANAGSYRFYSVNPSLMAVNFWAQFSNSPSISYLVGAGMTFNGTSTAGGWNMFIGFNYSSVLSPSSGGSKPRPHQPSPKDLEKFQEQTNDGVNQQLFQAPGEMSQPQQQPIPVIQQPEEDPANLHEILDKTEMKIQLKSDKKKTKKKKKDS